MGTTAQSAPAALPGAPAAKAEPPATAQTRQVSVQAGTGVLLRLPQPAATVMSAEPAIARVQPASPTSLFLMGVSAGRTTVIATNDTGTAIVQYDVTVTPGTASQPAPAAVARPAPTTAISSATAQAIQATIAQTVQGASNVRARGAGTDLILSGTVPNAGSAQQAEAIARGYVAEKSTVIDELTVLSGLQVNVRVRIAEIDRQITRQLGFNWQALGAANTWRFGLRTGAGDKRCNHAAAAARFGVIRRRCYPEPDRRRGDLGQLGC